MQLDYVGVVKLTVKQDFSLHHLQVVLTLELSFVDLDEKYHFQSETLLGWLVKDETDFTVGAFSQDLPLRVDVLELVEVEATAAFDLFDAAGELVTGVPVVETTLLRAVGDFLAPRAVPRLGNRPLTEVISALHVCL